MTGYWDDAEREEGTLTDVSGPHDGYYSVTSSTGWSCSVSAEYGVTPMVGDRFTTWGSFGRPIRGQAVNDRVLFYRTPEEQDTENARERERHQAKRIAEYEGKRAEYDARVAVLPEPLRDRIAGFREYGGDAWRWSNEPYELACCEEAARLHERFPDTDALRAFAKLPYEEQVVQHPNMDSGHSGNTWGAAIAIAHWLTANPALVPQMHAGICAMVGCEDAGCFAARTAKGTAKTDDETRDAA